jgi:DNA-binding NtrC family response regulator/tetratricopeptide (TPR) repeat protein
MNPIQEAKRLVRAGRFLDAHRALETGAVNRLDQTEAEVLRAELLERLGQHASARTEAEALTRSRRLTAGQRSACNLVLALTDIAGGRFDSAVTYLQRAIGIAHTVNDYERISWAQIRLLIIVSEHAGPDAVVSLLAELRANVARTADPVLAAALHVFVAQMEAKRGLLSSARRHVRLALAMLEGAPNAWLEAMSAQIEIAIAVMRSDFASALLHARRSVELAEQSGVANARATSHGNLANVLYLTGEYERAVEHNGLALPRCSPGSDNYIGAVDTFARIRLAQNRLDECDELLDKIDQVTRSSECRSRYAYRHALLIRINALARRERFEEALAHMETAIELAVTSSDFLLYHLAMLTKAELLVSTARVGDALDAMQNVAATVASQPPDVYALYERVLGGALSNAHSYDEALSHFERAARIYKACHHAPGLVELGWSWNGAATYHIGAAREFAEETGRQAYRDEKLATAAAVQNVAALMICADRLEFVGGELVNLLWRAGSVTSAAAVFRANDGSEEVLVTTGQPENADATQRRLSVGPFRDGEIYLVLRLKSDIESGAMFNAVQFLLISLQELRRARVEREERAALWPIEELPIDGERSVISGHMRELMNYARRIAKTTVTVLITGESGTGKEILARAIHDFSDRAHKPFVPFNCTTIPRDLLESQLFGHRRGAFTGADRDQLGLIRSAAGGTLFLDEVGELGLDLQPKLLRFLESGEISPLGEAGSLNVDVRIVAATNSNLEDAVRAGKFREDLFYRLNVVRLSIRPLRERRDEIPGFVNHFVARAAEEFRKGHLRVAEETMERLLLYRWPGNVRQLQNELRRMAALAEPDSTLLPNAISEEILGALPLLRTTPVNGTEIAVSLTDKLVPTLARVECEMIKAALHTHRGKLEVVAKALGISRKGLYLKRQRLGI